MRVIPGFLASKKVVSANATSTTGVRSSRSKGKFSAVKLCCENFRRRTVTAEKICGKERGSNGLGGVTVLLIQKVEGYYNIKQRITNEII